MADFDSHSIETSMGSYFNSSMMLSEHNSAFGTGRIIMNGFLLLADILLKILYLMEENTKSKDKLP